LPSRAQIAEIKPVVAALCLMRTSQQLLEHNVSTVGGQGDHGNRRRIDHYPKTIYAAIPMDKDREKWSIISPTLDIDGCHHTTDACVRSWEIALGRLPGVDFFDHLREPSMAPSQEPTADPSPESATAAPDSNSVDEKKRKRFELGILCDDRGGGGAVQMLQPEMKQRKVMPANSVYSSCSLHGASNSLKYAW
jgi:hypothetical protein